MRRHVGAVLSSNHIRAARAGLAYSSNGTKSAVAVSMTISRGMDLLGARDTPGFTDTDFTKLVLQSGYDRAFGKYVVVRLKLVGQAGTGLLPGSERLAIGGAEFGRAFETALVSGDSGVESSLEVAFRPHAPKRLEASEIYGFAEGAWLHVKAREGGREKRPAESAGRRPSRMPLDQREPKA